MAIYKIEVERWVSRRVDLRQTATIFVKADNHKLAEEAAMHLCIDGEEEAYFNTGEWLDDRESRQASNDEVEVRPRVSGDAIKTAAKPKLVADARTILNMGEGG